MSVRSSKHPPDMHVSSAQPPKSLDASVWMIDFEEQLNIYSTASSLSASRALISCIAAVTSFAKIAVRIFPRSEANLCFCK